MGHLPVEKPGTELLSYILCSVPLSLCRCCNLCQRAVITAGDTSLRPKHSLQDIMIHD